MPRTEKFAERLWGHLRENRKSLDSERWCAKIVELIEEQVAIGIAPQKERADRFELANERNWAKLKEEKLTTDHLRQRIIELNDASCPPPVVRP